MPGLNVYGDAHRIPATPPVREPPVVSRYPFPNEMPRLVVRQTDTTQPESCHLARLLPRALRQRRTVRAVVQEGDRLVGGPGEMDRKDGIPLRIQTG